VIFEFKFVIAECNQNKWYAHLGCSRQDARSVRCPQRKRVNFL
jgi:hypothetical protein